MVGLNADTQGNEAATRAAPVRLDMAAGQIGFDRRMGAPQEIRCV